jgi:hypothetical protein
MRRTMLILFLWLIIGALAAGRRGLLQRPQSRLQPRGDEGRDDLAAGPLNYVGLSRRISCGTPKPSVGRAPDPS